MKGDTVDFRLFSLYSNSSSAIDLELFYHIVTKAVGNWKEALSPPRGLCREGTRALSLKKRLPLCRASWNTHWQPCTEKWLPLYQSGGEHVIKTCLPPYRNKSAPNPRESITYQRSQLFYMDSIMSHSVQTAEFSIASIHSKSNTLAAGHSYTQHRPTLMLSTPD